MSNKTFLGIVLMILLLFVFININVLKTRSYQEFMEEASEVYTKQITTMEQSVVDINNLEPTTTEETTSIKPKQNDDTHKTTISLPKLEKNTTTTTTSYKHVISIKPEPTTKKIPPSKTIISLEGAIETTTEISPTETKIIVYWFDEYNNRKGCYSFITERNKEITEALILEKLFALPYNYTEGTITESINSPATESYYTYTVYTK